MTVRSPAVAGRFYPADPDVLAREVDRHVATTAPADAAPKAIVAPHAGYVYSGPVAGTAYATLRDASHVERVLLLGPAHTKPVRGMAITAADTWRTPLGDIAVDAALRDRLVAGHDLVTVDDRPHRHEHGLEVHLPFLQRTIGTFTLLPVVVGDTPAAAVADLLDDAWGGDETLIVVSTDLSHYLDHETAVGRDRTTCDAIGRLDPDALGHGDACGYFPLRGFLVAARRHGLRLGLLDRRTSADTAGDPERVVGYAAFAAEPARGHAGGELEPLLAVATEAIARRLVGERGWTPELDGLPARLRQPGAAFVSLHRGDQLLGCIGTLEATRPLALEVADKAVAAAFHDPRLPAVTEADFCDMEVEVSVLSQPSPLAAGSYAELLATVAPGSGLTVVARRRRATLLPLMWEKIGDRTEFVAALWQKAGLTPGSWPRGIAVEQYDAVEVTDPGPRPTAAALLDQAPSR